MRTIWKFALDECVMMPRGATVLTVQLQGDTPCIWALVYPDAVPEPRRFRVFGTGWDLPAGELAGLRYVNTFQQDGLVFHVFEEKL